jgi:hypothetical protein
MGGAMLKNGLLNPRSARAPIRRRDSHPTAPTRRSGDTRIANWLRVRRAEALFTTQTGEGTGGTRPSRRPTAQSRFSSGRKGWASKKPARQRAGSS